MVFKKRGFTLIELLLVIFIMGAMTALLVPNIDRALRHNKIAWDAEVYRSLVEQAKLKAGTYEPGDEPTEANLQPIGYYGVFVDQAEARMKLFKLSNPTNGTFTCNQTNFLTDPSCTVETIPFTKAVEATAPNDEAIAFQVPSKKLVKLKKSGVNWVANSPEGFAEIKLQYKRSSVKINIENFSGRVNFQYEYR